MPCDPFLDQGGMLSLRSCLKDPRRILLFMLRRYAADGEDLIDTKCIQCTVGRQRRPKEEKGFLLLLFKFPCLTTKYEFYFTLI